MHFRIGEAFIISPHKSLNTSAAIIIFPHSLDFSRDNTYNNKSKHNYLLPQADKNNHQLKYILRNGTMVLFYENNPDELYKCSIGELSKRLYKITGLNKDGRIIFTFHQEAREDKAIKAECGMGISKVDVRKPMARLRLSLSNIKICVEGYDFELTVTGEIKFKHKK